MQQTIRCNMFETNSSSMHALILYKHGQNEPELDSLKYNVCLDYRYQDFSTQGGENYSGAEDILAYIYAAVRCGHDSDTEWKRNVKRKLKQWVPNCTFSSNAPPDVWEINHQSNEYAFIKYIMSDKELFKWALFRGEILLLSDGCDYILKPNKIDDVGLYMSSWGADFLAESFYYSIIPPQE